MQQPPMPPSSKGRVVPAMVDQLPDEPDGSGMPVCPAVEDLLRWPDVLKPGEEVVITEKLKGDHARYCFHARRLWVGSHKRIKADNERSQWWRAARQYDLAEKLARAPGLVLFGEVHGYTGGYPYGVERGGLAVRLFDVWDRDARRYLDWSGARAVCMALDLETVPVLYHGPWSDELRALAEGPSTLDPSHVREGIVVRPARERWHDRIGRVVLKLHGEGFLVGKGKARA